MARFRKLPVVIDAIRITKPITIQTDKGKMGGDPGDWLITGVEGETYPCDDAIFRKTYEPVDDESRELLESSG